MTKQPIIVTDSSSPDHTLTFEEIVYKGYDAEDDRNKNDSFSVRGCPLIVFGTIDTILYHNDIARLRYMSDVERYATILGAAIFQNSEKIETIIDQKRRLASGISDTYSMFSLNTTTSIQHVNSSCTKKTSIKTVCWVKEFIQSNCRYLGLDMQQFGTYVLIEGLYRATIPNMYYKEGLQKEREMFWLHVTHEVERVKG